MTQDCIQGLIASAPENQDLLADKTSSVIKDIEVAISRGCESVQEMTKVADSAMDNVQEATKKMNSSCKESTNSYTIFMDSAGNSLKEQLGKHMTEVGVFFDHQEQVSSNTMEEVNKFKALSNNSAVVPTGQTPVKASFHTPLKKLL